MTLDGGDLNETDEGILEMLNVGRCTPRYIAGELDRQQPYINQRLKRLLEHGHVARIDRGLYELSSDPRDIGSAEVREENGPNRQDQPRSSGNFESGTQTGGGAEIGTLRKKMEARLEELDVTGRPAEVEETRREAIKWAWEKLREEGEMQAKVLADEVFYEFEDRPNLGYSASSSRYDGYQLWDSCIREVLRELPGVHSGSRSAAWTFEEP